MTKTTMANGPARSSREALTPPRRRRSLPPGLSLLLDALDLRAGRCGRAVDLRWRLLPRRRLPSETLLERVHEIDHLGTLGLGTRRGDLSARHLLLDGGQDPLAVVVLVLARHEFLVRQLIDEARRQ